MSLNDITDDELKTDLADIKQDIILCVAAIGLGIEEYKNDKGEIKNVARRLKDNLKMVDIIMGEMKRRSKDSML